LHDDPAVNREHSSRLPFLVLIALGLFGAALLYGDGMITPAISVLSAVEGISIATHRFEPYVVPATVTILIVLFWFQHRGTGGMGKLFGPIMIVWFVLIAALGVPAIRRNPIVLGGVNPAHAIQFFVAHGWTAFLTLGAVFLSITGAEALYADMGHFGPRPIRIAWFAFVLPALVINYFGQGALLLSDPSARLADLTLIANSRIGMSTWRDKLFIFLSHNARRATNFFHIPPDRVVEIEIQLEI
jgi:KUP system potassium uptake protein